MQHFPLTVELFQQSKVAILLVVKLYEESIEGQAENGVRDLIVGGVIELLGAQVALAHMQGNGHVLGLAGQNLLGRPVEYLPHLVQVEACLGDLGLKTLIAEGHPNGIVQLQIPAPGSIEGRNGCLIDLYKVRSHGLDVLAVVIVLIGGDGVQEYHIGAGDVQLGGNAIFIRHALCKYEMINERMILVPGDPICDGGAAHQRLGAEQVHGIGGEFYAVRLAKKSE